MLGMPGRDVQDRQGIRLVRELPREYHVECRGRLLVGLRVQCRVHGTGRGSVRGVRGWQVQGRFGIGCLQHVRWERVRAGWEHQLVGMRVQCRVQRGRSDVLCVSRWHVQGVGRCDGVRELSWECDV